MAGTLEVSTIKSGAANTPPVIQDSAGTEVIQGVTARVLYNGTGTPVVVDSFNISSTIVDNGAGDHSFTYLTAMDTAEVTFATGVLRVVGNTVYAASVNIVGTPSTTGFRVMTATNDTTLTDFERVSITITGGK